MHVPISNMPAVSLKLPKPNTGKVATPASTSVMPKARPNTTPTVVNTRSCVAAFFKEAKLVGPIKKSPTRPI